MDENPVKLTPEERNRIIEEVFLPYIDDLERFLFRLTNGNPEATDDLVQETFLRVIKSVETFKEGTNAKAWLFMIGKNVFINKYRKDKKMPIDGDTETVKKHPHITDEKLSRSIDFTEAPYDSMMSDEVVAALNQLKPQYRDILLLFLEGFKYAEIAVIEEIPEGTVRSRLHRSREQMQQFLMSYAAKIGYNTDDAGKAKKNKKNKE